MSHANVCHYLINNLTITKYLQFNKTKNYDHELLSFHIILYVCK